MGGAASFFFFAFFCVVVGVGLVCCFAFFLSFLN